MPPIKKNKNSVVDSSSYASHWKKRQSEIRGYQRAFYCNSDEGDFLRVDYNLKDKRVRLYLEAADEGGMSYYGIIEKGEVVSEKNLTTGRSVSLNEKFSDRASIWASLPSKDIINLIGKNYGIKDELNRVLTEKKKQKLEKTRQRYFIDSDEEKDAFFGDFSDEKTVEKKDFIDIIIGLALSILIFYFTLNFMMTGGFLAFYGIAIGAFDMFYRSREPIFFKILVMVALGFVVYIYGNFVF